MNVPSCNGCYSWCYDSEDSEFGGAFRDAQEGQALSPRVPGDDDVDILKKRFFSASISRTDCRVYAPLLQMLVSKRRRMMQYLKRTDIEEFGRVVRDLGLAKEASHLK